LLYSHPIYQLAIKIFLPRCTFLFANSNHTKELAIARGAIPNRIEVINPGLDFKEFSCIQEAEFFLKQVDLKNRKVILSVGRLVTRKGIPEFIEHVISHLVTIDPGLLFLVVGENPTQSLTHKEDIKTRIIETVKKFNLSDNVLLLGHVGRQELMQLYSIADIFVLPAMTIPNDVEGFGIVLLEAGAAGCPAVSTRLGGIPDAVADGQSGLLVEPDDWHAMTAAIIRLLRDRSFRKYLGRNSRERARDFFDWPIIGERYLSLLRNLKTHNQNEII
jgi:phosphatidylinositol alpha-1,6-mannosyltransferase